MCTQQLYVNYCNYKQYRWYKLPLIREIGRPHLSDQLMDISATYHSNTHTHPHLHKTKKAEKEVNNRRRSNVSSVSFQSVELITQYTIPSPETKC